MRKRGRENPCPVCGHYHKYEEGEVCGICGHGMLVSSDTPVHVSAFPSEILPDFLYLGSYDNASRCELLKVQGISCILNTVPSCPNLYRSTFTYHDFGAHDDKVLQFDDAIKFLDQCDKDKTRVLVHCMSGKSRSPAFVIAYLMKRKGWRLAESHQWVKQRRPSTDINPELYQQLQEFEQTIFNDVPTLGFGFTRVDNNPVQAPMFNNAPNTSIFSSPASSIPPQEFTFGAAPNHRR